MSCPVKDLTFYDFDILSAEVLLFANAVQSLLGYIKEEHDRPEEKDLYDALSGVERMAFDFKTYFHSEGKKYVEWVEDIEKIRALAGACRPTRAPDEDQG